MQTRRKTFFHKFLFLILIFELIKYGRGKRKIQTKGVFKISAQLASKFTLSIPLTRVEAMEKLMLTVNMYCHQNLVALFHPLCDQPYHTLPSKLNVVPNFSSIGWSWKSNGKSERNVNIDVLRLCNKLCLNFKAQQYNCIDF